MEGMGQCETQDGQAAWEPCPSRADARSPAGLRCPGISFPCTLPSLPPAHIAPPARPPPPHACSHSHALPLFSPPPGLEQLRKLRHLDVAYNLLEEHRALAPLCLLAELRKVRLGRFKDREASFAPLPPSRADVVSALPPTGRLTPTSVSFLPLSSTWRETLCGSTLHTERPPPSTCHPGPGVLLLE